MAHRQTQMNPRKGLVLDANILMRAVLARRVRELLEAYEDVATFYTPDISFEDARHYVPQVLEKRGLNPSLGSVFSPSSVVSWSQWT